MFRLAKKSVNPLISQVQSNLTRLSLIHNSSSKTLEKDEEKPIKNQSPFLINARGLSTQYAHSITGTGGFMSMNFVRGILEEEEQNSRKKKGNVVHVLMVKKKVFVTVTDAQGNKKMGASAGSLEDRKGRSRLSRYAAEATAEHVGRAARKFGLKAVVMKVKGSTYFRKKRKVVMSWRDGFRGEAVSGRSGILSIYDVTQLPHNGCRLPKKRRV